MSAIFICVCIVLIYLGYKLNRYLDRRWKKHKEDEKQQHRESMNAGFKKLGEMNARLAEIQQKFEATRSDSIIAQKNAIENYGSYFYNMVQYRRI